MAYVKNIKSGEDLYNLRAAALSGQVSTYNTWSDGSGKTLEGVKIVNEYITVDPTKGINTKEAVISLNQKGNVSIESPKHINLEPSLSVQIKPTNGIIIDTGKRIEKEGGNECSIEVKYDDYKASEAGVHPGDDEPHGELKIKARNIDLRCLEHGGIAIQPCGQDGNLHENKIKFESSRTNAITEPVGQYVTEGGKGLEFGTFNNLHTSLFTNDYRFNKNGKVYAATRGAITQVSTGKVDYPTQGDDFKDIINSGDAASWYEIVKVARDYSDGKITGGTGSGGTQYTAGDNIKIEAGQISVTGLNQYAQATDTTVFDLQSRIFRKEKNGNLEVSAEGLKQWEETTKSATTIPATLDFVSDGKIAIKSDVFAIEGTTIELPLEINKNGKVKAAGVDETGKAKNMTADNITALDNNVNTVLSAFDFDFAIVVKNEFGGDGDYSGKPDVIAAVNAAYPNGSKIKSVKVFDLLKRVETLEAKVIELEGRINTYHPEA